MVQKKASLGFLLMVASLLAGRCQAHLKDGCKIETLRSCGDDYVPFGNQVSYPESGQAFKDKCENELRQLECSLKFVDECLKGVPKTAASISLNAFKDYIVSGCAIGSKENEEYMKVIGCINSVGKNVSSCMRDLKRDLQRAVVKAPTKDVIPHVCCLYGIVEGCVQRTVTPCRGVGGDVYATSVLKKVFGSTLAIVCDEYTGNDDACKALPTLPELGPNDPRADNYAELLIRAANTIGHRQ